MSEKKIKRRSWFPSKKALENREEEKWKGLVSPNEMDEIISKIDRRFIKGVSEGKILFLRSVSLNYLQKPISALNSFDKNKRAGNESKRNK